MSRMLPSRLPQKENATNKFHKMIMDSGKVFISYARKDLPQVSNVVDKIEKALAIKCWIDLNGIESGQIFVDNIMSAIEAADTILFMLSSNSLDSVYARKEVNYANSLGKRIVPIILDGDRLRGWFLFEFGLIDYVVASNEEHVQKLIRNLRSWIVPEVDYEIPEVVSAKSIEKQAVGSLNIKEIRKRANDGENESQYLLGRCYLYGSDGLKQNSSYAVMWLNKAATAGNISAQYLLGEHYEEKLNYDNASKWYRVASESGHSGAMLRLGHMYELGYGVSKDVKKALKYYGKALELGETEAKKYYEQVAGLAIVSISRIQIRQVESDPEVPVVRFAVKIKGENLKGHQLKCVLTFKQDKPFSRRVGIDCVPSDYIYKGTFGTFTQFSPDNEGEVVNDLSFNIPCSILSEYGNKGEWPLVATITIMREEGDKSIELTQKSKIFILKSRKHLLSRRVVYELQ